MAHHYSFRSLSEKAQHHSLDHLVDRACRHWEARRLSDAIATGHAEALESAYTITIGREAGVDGTAVGNELGRRLGWPTYDHELLERMAQEMGLRIGLLENVDEKRISWFQETVEDFIAVPRVKQSVYVQCLIRTVLALGTQGECIIVGRGAAFILPSTSTLRVRLVAPLADRVRTLSRQLNVSEQEAARRVRAIDQERRDFVQNYFHQDPTDADNYDLVLNVARYPLHSCVDLILDTLRRLPLERQRQSCSGIPC